MSNKYAAVYARTSREFKGVERVSIEQQIEDGTALAVSKKLVSDTQKQAVREFRDPDRSGSLPPRQWLDGGRKHREALTALIDAVERGEVSAVVVRKLDRLARGTELTLRLLRLFQDHKVRLLATDEQLPGSDDDSGLFTLTVLAAAAEYELKKISRNTKAGLAYIKRHGGKIGSARTLGYCDGKEKGTVEVVEPEAALVREVFTRLVAGESLCAVGRWLTTQTDRRGKHKGGWMPDHIAAIIRNPRYIGMQKCDDGTLQPSKVFPAIIEPTVYWDAQKA